MMPPDLIEVFARVQEQLGEQLDLLDRAGGDYVREYALAALERPTQPQACRPPAGMHPAIRKMIRELVLDELAVRRISQRDMVAASLIADDTRTHHRDVYPRRTGSAAA